MILQWDDILNGESLADIRNKINMYNRDNITELSRIQTNLDQHQATLDNHTTRLNTLETNVSDHESRISTNTTNITSLTTRMDTAEQDIININNDLGTLDTRVGTLESYTFEPVYEYQLIQDVDVAAVNPDWQEILNLNITDAPIGTYEFTISLAWQLDTTSSSACVRYSLDGGNTWVESCEEPKDRTDVRHTMFGYPLEHPAVGNINIIVQSSKTSSSTTLTIKKGSLVIKKVKE